MSWISRQVERKSNNLIHNTDVKDRKKMTNTIMTKTTVEMTKSQASDILKQS